MLIFPLSDNPNEAVKYHADIHLRNSIAAITKILSDAAHFVLDKDSISREENSLGEKEYLFNKVKILPPSGSIGVWSKWVASNQFNAWWMVDLAYQINGEYNHRFGDGKSVLKFEQYDQIQLWVMSGLIKLFPRPKDKKVKDEFPLILPLDFINTFQLDPKTTVVDIYQNFYVSQRGKIRYRWTKRTLPPFFPEPSVPF